MENIKPKGFSFILFVFGWKNKKFDLSLLSIWFYKEDTYRSLFRIVYARNKSFHIHFLWNWTWGRKVILEK